MLNLTIQTNDGEAVQVRCAGSINQQSLEEGNPLERLLGPGLYTRQVRLNLEAVEYLDSRGIGWLVECHKYFRQGGGALSLSDLPPRIHQILQFCSLDRYFHIIPDETGGHSGARPEAT